MSKSWETRNLARGRNLERNQDSKMEPILLWQTSGPLWSGIHVRQSQVKVVTKQPSRESESKPQLSKSRETRNLARGRNLERTQDSEMEPVLLWQTSRPLWSGVHVRLSQVKSSQACYKAASTEQVKGNKEPGKRKKPREEPRLKKGTHPFSGPHRRTSRAQIAKRIRTYSYMQY